MSDPNGYQLLADRVSQSREALLDLAGEEALGIEVPDNIHWLASGLGSSEAHARYLVGLINAYTGASAEWANSARLKNADSKKEGIIYFTQGLSDNALAAIDFWLENVDQPLILVTASNPELLRGDGKEDRAEILENLIEKGAQIYSLPELSEYTILIRVLGPLCGYWTALQLLQSFPGCRFELPDKACLTAVLDDAQAIASQLNDTVVEQWILGSQLNICSRSVECFQNIALKRLEGIYKSATVFRDAVQYAHGSFQVASLSKRPQWLLYQEEEIPEKLLSGFREMNKGVGIPFQEIKCKFSYPLDIFFYESLFNEILLRAVDRLDIDQINWPAKGKDGPLYTWRGDFG